METSDVLNMIEGLTKRMLYYLEEIHFIKPLKVIAGKIAKREYSDEDIKKIKSVMPYLRKGYTPKVAVSKVLKSDRQVREGKALKSLGEREEVDQRLTDLLELAKSKGVKLGFTSLERMTEIQDLKIKRDLIKIIETLIKE